MNILILSWRGPGHPNAGGAEQVTFEHAKAWVKAGHEVYLFTSNFRGAKKEEILSGVRVKRRGRQFFDVQLRAFLWYVFGRKHPSFELVIDEFHGLPFFTPLYVRVRKLAFIHEIAGEVWKLNPWKKPFNMIPAFFGTTLEPWLFKMIYRKIPFMTVSKSTRDDLTNWGINKKQITVIHNGVKLENAPKKLPGREFKRTAMYLGALSEDKGIFDVINVFYQINRKDEDWQFWVVGKGSDLYIKRSKDKAKELSIMPKIKFWGFVSEKKKFELLARAHVLVNPSAKEGWGLVNIEANAMGVPVVGYDVAGMRDSVKSGKTGLLVEPGDDRAIAEAVVKLLYDKEKYSSLKDNAISWSKKFSWEKATQESLQLIESI